MSSNSRPTWVAWRSRRNLILLAAIAVVFGAIGGLSWLSEQGLLEGSRKSAAILVTSVLAMLAWFGTLARLGTDRRPLSPALWTLGNPRRIADDLDELQRRLSRLIARGIIQGSEAAALTAEISRLRTAGTPGSAKQLLELRAQARPVIDVLLRLEAALRDLDGAVNSLTLLGGKR